MEEAEEGEVGGWVGVGARVEGVTDSAGVTYRVAEGGGGSPDSSPLWTTAASLPSVWRTHGSKPITHGSKIGEFN